jgi:hypothetical protein
MASTVADYDGRQVDLAAFRGVFAKTEAREQLLSQELAGPSDGGAVVAGVFRLAQSVLITLMTKRGSKKNRPEGGTDFVTDGERGQWRTTADVQQSFYLARLDVKQQIQAVESTSDPEDERYGDLELTGVILNGDRVTIRVYVQSLAGTDYTFLTPITVPVR